MSLKAIIAVLALLSAVPANAEEGWKPVWADEFDGDQLDLSKWSYAVDCGGGGNDELQCYTASPDVVSVKDGVLRLTTIKRRTTGRANPWSETPGPMVVGDYASGKILTKGKASWRYGRIEARVRLPRGQGVWPAVWMMPEKEAYGGWPKSGEIDIVEAVNLGAVCLDCSGGGENRAFGTIHFAVDAAGTHRQVSNAVTLPPPADGFHVYAVEWTPEDILWSIDGRRYARATAEDWKRADRPVEAAPFDQPFHLILNLAFGGRWPEGANAKGVDETALPATLEVDWVRVSQRTGD